MVHSEDENVGEVIKVAAVLKVIENRWRYEAQKAISLDGFEGETATAEGHQRASEVLGELLNELDFMLMPAGTELH